MTKDEYYAAIAPLLLLPVGAIGGAVLVVVLWQASPLIVYGIFALFGLLGAPVRWFLSMDKPIERAVSVGTIAGMVGATTVLALGWMALVYVIVIFGAAGIAAFAIRRGLAFAFQQGLKAWRNRKGVSGNTGAQ